MMKWYCVLCGYPCNPTGQPGTLAYCSFHAWKGGKRYTEREARNEGKKRVSFLSDGEREQEGRTAYHSIVQLEEERERFQQEGLMHLVEITEKILLMKKAYLSAFD